MSWALTWVVSCEVFPSVLIGQRTNNEYYRNASLDLVQGLIEAEGRTCCLFLVVAILWRANMRNRPRSTKAPSPKCVSNGPCYIVEELGETSDLLLLVAITQIYWDILWDARARLHRPATDERCKARSVTCHIILYVCSWLPQALHDVLLSLEPQCLPHVCRNLYMHADAGRNMHIVCVFTINSSLPRGSSWPMFICPWDVMSASPGSCLVLSDSLCLGLFPFCFPSLFARATTEFQASSGRIFSLCKTTQHLLGQGYHSDRLGN